MRFTYEIQFDAKHAENVSTGNIVDLTNQDVKVPGYTVNDYVNGTLEIFQDTIDNDYDNLTNIDALDYNFNVDSFVLSIVFDVELSDPENTDEFVDFKNSTLYFENSSIIVTSNEEDYELQFEDNTVR